MPPNRAAPPPARPSLCSAGPCRRYHRLVTQVDAESPRAVRVRLPVVPGAAAPVLIPGAWETPQGTMYRAPATFHVQTHHYCYPSPGIEMPLGALPVVECNLWDPAPDAQLEERRAAFARSGSGIDYNNALEVWGANHAAVLAEEEEASRLIAQSVAGAPLIACQSCGQQFEETDLDIEMRCAQCRSVRPTLNPQHARSAP